MYYQNYEDYIRSILGYPVMTANGQYGNNISNTYNYEYVSNRPTYNQDILNLYPEIYKILNPMICKICEANTKPITEELLNQMTDEIYLNIESDGNINNRNTNTNLRNTDNSSKTSNNRTTEKNKETNREENTESMKNETRQARTPRNPVLRDLIKILILNQLLFGNSWQRPRPRPRQRPRYFQDNQLNQIRPQMLGEDRYYRDYLN